MALAVAALRNLATKIRTPGPSTLMALRAPGPLALVPLPPPPSPPEGDLRSALLLKDKIESAGYKELMFSGDLIALHCEKTEELLGQAAESHAQVARSVRDVALFCFCTASALSATDKIITSYYHKKDEIELKEGRLEAECEPEEDEIKLKEGRLKAECEPEEDEIKLKEGRLKAECEPEEDEIELKEGLLEADVE